MSTSPITQVKDKLEKTVKLTPKKRRKVTIKSCAVKTVKSCRREWGLKAEDLARVKL